MKKPCRHIIAVLFACLLPIAIYAEAPVVDESDNFATYDQDQAPEEHPLANDTPIGTRHGSQQGYRDMPDTDFPDEQPLARETSRANSGNNASLLNQIQSLQKEVQDLRGQIEVQAHELKVLKEQQLTFYKDIDTRLHSVSVPSSSQTPAPSSHSKPITAEQPAAQTPIQQPASKIVDNGQEGATAPTVIPVDKNFAHPNNPAEEQIHYLAAYDLIKSKRFNEAISAMQSFVNQYPKGGYTANAHYWLGELYMTQKNYPKAINHFDIVLQQFSSSSKAAPSLLKIAYALAASGKKQDAIVRLKQVIKNYPDTNTAQLAEEKLRSLGASNR